MKRLLLPALLALAVVARLAPALPPPAFAQEEAYGTAPQSTAPRAVLPGSQTAWRLRIKEAAVVHDDVVRLGDIALPLGNVSEQEWRQLAAKPLWAAPDVAGKPLQINKQRLGAALRESLGDLADSCILPNSLAVQRGGAVWYEEDLRALVVRTLTPQINLLGGHGEMTDFRLPAYAFTAHDGQTIALERVNVTPGRINLRFNAQEMDGSSVRRFTGSTFLDLWMDVPCASRPLNKGEALTPESLTFVSVNLAYQKGAVWDGRGGPWQVIRSIGSSQPIMATDLAPLAAIHRGDKITLVYQRGNVQLSTMVEAMEEGGPGDTIAVRNLESKKQIYATVVDQNTVRTR